MGRKSGRSRPSSSSSDRIRYAVVGLGYIAQYAVLPAFKNAKNSELVALVSDDPVKRKKLGKKYGVERSYSYDEYEECLRSEEIDAVYIALPNNLHCEYTIKAARAGVHVLCEKPMAVTEEECESMIREAEANDVRLMIAYRLHFEEANLKAVEICESGKLGELRIFNSVFSQQVKEGDIRLKRELGGGTLYDIGIYCINAARYIFQDEPIEVTGFSANNGERRFKEVDEMTSAVLRFDKERLAAFTCSFGASDVSAYEVIGTKGSLRVDPAYEFAEGLRHEIRLNGRRRERSFRKRDQFAPQLIYFSNCVLEGSKPEPSGEEGLADVRVIRAIYHSAAAGKSVSLERFDKKRRPTIEQEIKRPAVDEPELVHAESPSGGD